MRQQDSWFYRTEQFWLAYPHWAMPRVVKAYYLTQFAYWSVRAPRPHAPGPTLTRARTGCSKRWS